ncbi:MAG: glycosyltransferase family 2 protein [Flavobacteriales bacterium]|nr:glycosyltransferase family 2 protein [Flavobacteriales bacterium]
MNVSEMIFWLLLLIVFYTYIGYGIVLFIIVRFKELVWDDIQIDQKDYEPEVTIFIAAYNEMPCLKEKLANTLSLDYPKEKIQILFITDGSNDGSEKYLKAIPEVNVEHESMRLGKIGAINRGMQFVKNPIVIFSDANTTLNTGAVKEIVKHFKMDKVGCVSGEKRIKKEMFTGASSEGEGFYWKYESFLKKLDAKLYSAVGAAGELFAIRKELFKPVRMDTILDDFIISMEIVRAGYTIAYEPEAYASEFASPSVREEMKRKIRISAGGIQSIIRLSALLNVFRYGVVSFQYISHRVLRWTITPICLIALIPINFILIEPLGTLYTAMFYGQILFYSLAFIGWFLDSKGKKVKMLFIPFYFLFMNMCVFLGFYRLIKGDQMAVWDKAKRITI